MIVEHLFDDEVGRLVLGDVQLVSGLLEARRVVVAVDDRHADVDASGQRRSASVPAHDHRARPGLDLVVEASSRRQLVLLARQQLAQRERRRRRTLFQTTRHLQADKRRAV